MRKLLIVISILFGSCKSTDRGISEKLTAGETIIQLTDIYSDTNLFKFEYQDTLEVGIKELISEKYQESYVFDLKNKEMLVEYVFLNHFKDEVWKRIKFNRKGQIDKVSGKGIFVTGNFYDSKLKVKDVFEARVYLAQPIFAESHITIQEVFADSVVTYVSEKIKHMNKPYIVKDNLLTVGYHKQLYINTLTSEYFEVPIVDTFIIDFYVREEGKK